MTVYKLFDLAIPWEGVLIVFFYGTLVRFWLRPVLSGRWSYFREHATAPYYCLFIGGMLAAMGMVLLEAQELARHAAMISFFALVAAAMIEVFSKVASTRNTPGSRGTTSRT